jgi:hypothetical protein
MANLLFLPLRLFERTGYPSSCRWSYFSDRFTKFLVHIVIDIMTTHGKFGGDTIQHAAGRRNQILSHSLVNLLLLRLRFLWKDRLPITMPLLLFLWQVYEIAGEHCPRYGKYAW